MDRQANENFLKISLSMKIEAIKDEVGTLTRRAIDALRNVGNIRAHIERDVNVIVDVEPGEASQPIGRIEMLNGDWYLNGFEREKPLQSLVNMVEMKKTAKKGTITLPISPTGD